VKFNKHRINSLTMLGFAITFASFIFQDSDLEESKKRGEKIYMSYCITCHLDKGQGIPGAFPPLANSDYLMADKERAIRTILNGLTEEITVNGQVYFGEMTPQDLNDREVADVLNFIMNNWGNNGETVLESEVTNARKIMPDNIKH